MAILLEFFVRIHQDPRIPEPERRWGEELDTIFNLLSRCRPLAAPP
jgi:hypothetical protein